jgi:hypothetical protein
VVTEQQVRAALAAGGTIGPLADCIVYITIAKWGPGSAGLPDDSAGQVAMEQELDGIVQYCQAQQPAPLPPQPAPASQGNGSSGDVYYDTCEEVWADVGGPIYDGDPGYADWLDADGDGEACEVEPGAWDENWEPDGSEEFEG